MIRIAIALLAAAAIAGLWWHGYKKGERDDKARSDLVIAEMLAKATEAKDAASKANAELSRKMLTVKEAADRELQTQIDRNNRRRADAAATDALVREQLAEFARGPGPGADTVAACRADAQALDLSLGRALQTSRLCAGDYQEAADVASAVQAAWPSMTNQGKP